MAFIHRIFLVDFNELALFIINFLPEPEGLFGGVHFLEIARKPAEPSRNVEHVTSAAIGQIFPATKLAFVLSSVAHDFMIRLRCQRRLLSPAKQFFGLDDFKNLRRDELRE